MLLRNMAMAVLFCVATAAWANEAAPYSAEANERLHRVQRKLEAPEIGAPDSLKNVANYLDYLNRLYARADYDFPLSLADYYRDAAERNDGSDPGPYARFMADKVVTLHKLMAGMTAENAFPGKQYEAVRVTYARMRSAEQGNPLSADEIATAKKRRADVEATKAAKLQELENSRKLQSIGMGFVVAVIVICLGGFLLSPLWMILRRKKLAEDELRAPYVYIQKHAKYPVAADKDILSSGSN